jgi:hypothetical protein
MANNDQTQHAAGKDPVILKNTVTLLAQGVAWGALVFVIFYIIASLAGTNSHPLEIGLLVLGVVSGLSIVALKLRGYVSVDSSGVTVRRLVRSYHYSVWNIGSLATDMSSVRWLRSPLVTIYPYLTMNEGARIRLTPAGSTALKPPFTDPQIDGSRADKATKTIRDTLSHVIEGR